MVKECLAANEAAEPEAAAAGGSIHEAILDALEESAGDNRVAHKKTHRKLDDMAKGRVPEGANVTEELNAVETSMQLLANRKRTLKVRQAEELVQLNREAVAAVHCGGEVPEDFVVQIKALQRGLRECKKRKPEPEPEPGPVLAGSSSGPAPAPAPAPAPEEPEESEEPGIPEIVEVPEVPEPKAKRPKKDGAFKCELCLDASFDKEAKLQKHMESKAFAKIHASSKEDLVAIDWASFKPANSERKVRMIVNAYRYQAACLPGDHPKTLLEFGEPEDAKNGFLAAFVDAHRAARKIVVHSNFGRFGPPAEPAA